MPTCPFEKPKIAAIVVACVSAVVFILAVAALGAPRWIDYDTVSSGVNYKNYRGLWQSCQEKSSVQYCSLLKHSDRKGWENATIAMMLFGIFAICGACVIGILALFEILPVWFAGIPSACAGIFFLLAVCVYGGSVKASLLSAVDDATYYGACFGLTIICMFVSISSVWTFLFNSDLRKIILPGQSTDSEKQETEDTKNTEVKEVDKNEPEKTKLPSIDV
ncbi:hypothetical protein CHS0354_034610 [Potamilus streckersoni]|uniref:Claudin n=1 Tax=Potamilus streckersoni TaxID=2493646 RepID=A0AAE0SSL0_9BIVA|nr:hypothetical protein CHS0354_034610 [Potamilus streckersoni]